MKKDEGEKIIMFCLFCNMFLLAMKGSIGLLSGSQALTADAVNSAGDVLSSLVVLFGVRYSLKASDEEHPYGHGKMEALVSMIVGILILISVVLLIRDVITTISSQTMSEPSFYALGAAAAAIAVKAFMYKKTASVGKRLNSIAVMTNAKDHRNDIYATSGTLVAIGLSFIGQHFGVKVLSLYAEPALAVIMSVFIIKTAMEILIEASKMLLDAAPDKKTMGRMREITEAAEGVKRLNWIKCRKMGRGLLVDAAIEVAGDISVEKGHGIADTVKTALMAEYPEVLDVLVHINPEQQ
jgi:cation diffusion facilitator family transporter